jgi:hypothetical protein
MYGDILDNINNTAVWKRYISGVPGIWNVLALDYSLHKRYWKLSTQSRFTLQY